MCYFLGFASPKVYEVNLNCHKTFLLTVACLGLLSCRPSEDRNVQEPVTSKEIRDCDSDYLFSVYLKGKYGYINCAGNMTITPQFDLAHEFHEGLAAVEINDKWGFIDKTGKIVIRP